MLLIVGACLPAAAVAQASGDEVATGSTIDRIVIERRNIFDLENPDEDIFLYRLANRLHIMTREKTIRKQLLFAEGDAYDPRLIAESERILRGNSYFYDVSLKAEQTDSGGVGVTVRTRDVWTLMPEISISRSGGENKTIFGVDESNLLGYGQRVLITREDDVDRTSNAFEFFDRQLGSSRVALLLRLADNSDGDSSFLDVTKPFHALDSRWAAGFTAFDDERRSALYDLGDEAAEYRHERKLLSAFAGWSRGLRDDWVRRWTFGIVYDDNRFSAAPEPTLPQVIPDDRKLVYPFVGFEILEDRFEKSSNRDQIDRSEDFYLGTRVSARLGRSDGAIGAEREAWVYRLGAQSSFGTLERRALLLSADASGRRESGNTVNATTRLLARYYSQQSEKRLFFALLDATHGHELDLDNPVEIGGDSGLRGYPLRYQSGDSRLLFTVEQRYFTDWYPFRLFRVGGAVFFDAGRSWGANPLGPSSIGWLTDVGLGLRLAPTRIGTRKIIHLDIAFPLDGDPSIDSVQISLEAKRSF